MKHAAPRQLALFPMPLVATEPLAPLAKARPSYPPRRQYRTNVMQSSRTGWCANCRARVRVGDDIVWRAQTFEIIRCEACLSEHCERNYV